MSRRVSTAEYQTICKNFNKAPKRNQVMDDLNYLNESDLHIGDLVIRYKVHKKLVFLTQITRM